MKQIDSIAGKCYIATAPNGGTVTDEAGRTLATVAAGEQKAVWGTDGKLYLSDDDGKLVLATFNYAALALGLLGGGDNLLPAGYKRVEYLESTGAQYSDQYILTDACAGEETEVVFSAPYVNDTNRIFGIGVDVYSYFAGIQNNSSLFIRVRNAEQTFVYQPAAGYDTKHTVYIGREEVTLNGQIVSHAAYKMLEFHPDLYLTLFGQGRCDENYNVIGTGFGRPQTRIYSFRNWRGGILRGNYVPAFDETGAPCMFDTVTRKAFYNAGKGDFVTPREVSTYARRRVLPDWGKLTPTGLRRLYHTPANYEGELYDYALEHGYKPIVEEPAPEEGYWAPQWRETEEEIILDWVETEPPAEDELLTIEA